MSRVSVGLLVGLLAAIGLAFAQAAVAAEVTNAGDDLRTGWYPDEGVLTPNIVSGNTFGQLWSHPVTGQVYAQPLLAPSGILVVATEENNVYGLDPSTGDQRWMTPLGTPFDPASISCADITPSIGTTSTPVIDASTNTVYLTHKANVSGTATWFMDALDVSTGAEKPGFPVPLTGTADNDSSLSFSPATQQQRTGLLLMNGVVYAGFGSHCDVPPWQGWVFGVSTSGHITARWVDDPTGNGAGIWQSGAGLTSDRPGQILLATGNNGGPTVPVAGSSPPASCGECVIRLQVQQDGSLKPVDFFAPYDTPQLDNSDSDFGSGGVVGLPDQYFGTPAFPHLAVTVGKEGYVYLLNRDSLGGYDQGSGGGDNLIQPPIGPRGGVWGRAGVWPGDGGYVYIPTSTRYGNGGLFDVYSYGLSGSGAPALSLAGSAWDQQAQPPGPAEFGWGSGSPVITSDGTNSGSAVVWITWSADRTGAGGQLRAYSAVPVNGQLTELGRWPIGQATNYFSPGVGAGRIYVGTRDGKVLAFGSPVTPALSGSGLSFPTTTEGSSSVPQTLTLTANKPLTITALDPSNPEFSRDPSLSVPVTLSAGQRLSVPVTFIPTQTGLIAGQLKVTTDAGNFSFPLSGTGQASSGLLQVNHAFLSLGGTAVGGNLSGTVTFSNAGASPLTVAGFTQPSAPFSASGAPAAGHTLQPGDSVTVGISFQPTSVGQYAGQITLSTTDNQTQTVQLSASASTPGLLEFSSQAIDFGSVPVGGTATRTFTITNAGGTAVTIEKSKPPFGGAFAAASSLPEGTTIGPGKSVTETVTFTPTSPGPASATWQVNGDDTSGLHQVQFTGSGAPAASTAASGSPTASGGSGPTAAGIKPTLRLPGAPKLVPSRVATTKLTSVHVTYTARLAGVSRFVLERATIGRASAHGCVAITRRNRSGPSCTRFVAVATFTRRDRVGASTLRLTGYVPSGKLGVGTYRLKSELLDSAGGKHSFTTPLRVITPPPPRRRAALVMPVIARLETLLEAALFQF